MMILKRDKIFKFLLPFFISFLAFTNVFLIEIGGFQISLYLAFGFFFVLLTFFLTFKVPLFKSTSLLLILLYILLSSLMNLDKVKWTSVIYSFLLVIYFLYLFFYSKKYLLERNFVHALKLVIIVFFIVLLISQLIVFFDMQTLKGPKGFFQSSGQLGILYNNITNQYRYNSLSSEPSYAAIIVFASFAVLERHIDNNRKLIFYGVIVLYMLLSFKSSIGFLIFGIWVLSQLTFSKKLFLIVGVISLIFFLLFFFTDIGGRGIDRIRKVVFLFLKFDGNFIHNLNIIDSSAYARIGPFLIYLQQIELLNYHTYFGHGAATSDYFFSRLFYPESWNTNLVFKAPFLPGFLYDYGFFGVFLVIWFLWGLVKDMNLFFKVILLIIMLNSNFNTQLFWYIIVIISISKYYLTNIHNSDNLSINI